MSCLRFALIVVFTGYINFVCCQNLNQDNLKVLDNLLAYEDYTNAKAFAQKQLDSLYNVQDFYNATDYVYYTASIESKLYGYKNAVKWISHLEKQFKSLTNNSKALRQLYLEIGSFYESVGKLTLAINYNLNALEQTNKLQAATAKDFVLIQSNLGVFYSQLGDIVTGTKYHQAALKSLQGDPKSSQESYYITYNSLGAMMWYASKFDSAVVYYKNAERALKSLEPNPVNSYYRPASLNNNIAGVYSVQGKFNEALHAMQITVNNLNAFLREEISTSRRNNAEEFLFQAIDNYAGLYKDMGDFNKAKHILSYSLEQKKKHLSHNSPEINKGKILLGQINYSLKNYQEAEILLDEGISVIESSSGNYTQWLADAYYHKALINFETKNYKSANTYFEISHSYFKKSMGDYYDEIYLNFIVNASFSHAKMGNQTKAVSMATDALDYIRANQGGKTLLEFHQILNLANIHFLLENYHDALKLSDEAIALLNSDDFVKTTAKNTHQISGYKVPAMLLKVKSNQKLHTFQDEHFFSQQLNTLKNAIKLLDGQKSIIADDQSTSILIRNNSEIFQLAKFFSLKLYMITKNESYLNELLNFHESLTYHKIRRRLNSKSVILSANLPEAVLEQEKRLKQQLSQYSTSDDDFNTYLLYEKEWQSHLNLLQKEFPEYYKLMHATIHQPLDKIQSKIPTTTTVLRYLYVDNKLYAVVLSPTQTTLVPINAENIGQKINQLNSKIETLDSTFQLQQQLYQALWQPIKPHLKTSKVIIIPDKELFNLSFELMTSKLINNHSQINNYSLLANYNLSYNYSLFLIDKNSKPVNYSSNFVAFAPEFSESMKSSYKIAIADSLKLDIGYLKLLPQPFAKSLAKNYSKFFVGDCFLNENASKQIFVSKAREHKIIHIGTHAESDNISPEFSRLIFAKKENEDENSLYNYEIYNQNLSSNLAILTACETGKPTFQPGEGMISLAHAFNYAGSESILTSLWNIDEQSSSEIIKYFYDNLTEGLAKDEALKQAKLRYLSTAKGRTLNPQYWAGLVLIGNADPVNLKTSNHLLYLITSLFVIFLILLVFRKRLTSFMVSLNK